MFGGLNLTSGFELGGKKINCQRYRNVWKILNFVSLAVEQVKVTHQFDIKDWSVNYSLKVELHFTRELCGELYQSFLSVCPSV